MINCGERIWRIRSSTCAICSRRSPRSNGASAGTRVCEAASGSARPRINCGVGGIVLLPLDVRLHVGGMRPKIGDLSRVKSIVIHTSHHTHYVIGAGANDPQKMDPKASRETLDHSIMYIFAVALEDGAWHHERSYAPERAVRPETVALWHKISTVEAPEWSRRYHSRDPKEIAFGGRVVVTLNDGATIEDELAVADAHPLGARPFKRQNYIDKFRMLAQGV